MCLIKWFIDTQRDIVFRFYQSKKKNLQICRLRKFLDNFGKINKVVVMGHSMSSVDSDYMELIQDILNPSE